jgi:broad specificity phosphatase PhoE
MTCGQENSGGPGGRSLFLAIIRHGQTTANQQGVIQGHGDSPLTGIGKASSLAKAAKLARFHFSAVYCSDLPRARATLEIIQGSLPGAPEPVFTGELREIDFGQYAGSRKSLIMDAVTRHKTDTSLKYPGGESGDDLAARVGGFIVRLRRTTLEGYALVVTHYGVIETMAKRHGGFPAGEAFTLGEEAVVVLRLWEAGGGELEIL